MGTRVILLLFAFVAVATAKYSCPATCGTKRWPVKIGTDDDVGKVNLQSPQETSVALLNDIVRPDGTLPDNNRVEPVEITLYNIPYALLVGVKSETDSDYVRCDCIAFLTFLILN